MPKNNALSRLLIAGTAFAALSMTSCMKEIDTSAANGEIVSSEAAVNRNGEQEFVPNELLVKFKPGVSQTAKGRALAKISATVSEKILTKAMERFNDKEGLLLVRTPLAVLEAKQKITGEDVEFAEPNFIYQHNAISNDNYYLSGQLWGVYGDLSTPANQYGSQAAEAWAKGHTGAETVYIGVIDEGAMYTHPDLANQIWTNPGEVIDGVDNDGNKYVDDIHGWDFDKNDNTTFDGSEDDHGTHVSGTIGAEGGNGIGIAGVSWNVTMISVKFLGRRGGTTANAVKAVDYITDLKTRKGLNIVATNNSWGGGGYSQSLYDAISRANSANILFVAAAGNGGSDGIGDNNDSQPHYPANYDVANVISVASITSSGAKSSFSNYGDKTVDIGAPGSGILSTVPGKNGAPGYASYSGTSMATPHVTGGVALYAACHPGETAAQIKTAIMSAAVPTGSLNGKCVSDGRLNVSGF